MSTDVLLRIRATNDASLLKSYANSSDAELRSAVAANESTPVATLERLCEDAHPQVLDALTQRGLRVRPRLRKPRKIITDALVFRNVNVDDAEFILSLRTDPENARHISATLPDLENQKKWLRTYESDPGQAYFIIEDTGQHPVGTVRLYNQLDDSISWGSWILKKGVPYIYSIISTMIVYRFALRLGFNRSHFEVRRQNSSVCRFHERFGALRTAELDHEFQYEISFAAIHSALQKYHEFLPEGIEVDW